MKLGGIGQGLSCFSGQFDFGGSLAAGGYMKQWLFLERYNLGTELIMKGFSWFVFLMESEVAQSRPEPIRPWASCIQIPQDISGCIHSL